MEFIPALMYPISSCIKAITAKVILHRPFRGGVFISMQSWLCALYRVVRTHPSSALASMGSSFSFTFCRSLAPASGSTSSTFLIAPTILLNCAWVSCR